MAPAAWLLEGAIVNFHLTFEGYLFNELGDQLFAEEVEQTLEAALEDLLEHDVPDATVGGALTSGLFEISLTVEAKTLDEAQATGFEYVLGAIQATGGYALDIEWVGFCARRSDITEGQPGLIGV